MTPTEALRFEPPFDKPRDATITLRNTSGAGNVTYKVKTTSPNRYVVKPRMGILAPQAEQIIKIQLRPVTSTATLRDKFQIESRLLTQAESEEKDNIDLAKLWKEASLPADSARLSCVFGSPPQATDFAPESSSFQTAMNQAPQTAAAAAAVPSAKGPTASPSPAEAAPGSASPVREDADPSAPSRDGLLISQEELTHLFSAQTKLKQAEADGKQKDEQVQTLRNRLKQVEDEAKKGESAIKAMKRMEDAQSKLLAERKAPAPSGSKLPLFILLILCLLLIGYILRLQGHI